MGREGERLLRGRGLFLYGTEEAYPGVFQEGLPLLPPFLPDEEDGLSKGLPHAGGELWALSDDPGVLGLEDRHDSPEVTGPLGLLLPEGEGGGDRLGEGVAASHGEGEAELGCLHPCLEAAAQGGFGELVAGDGVVAYEGEGRTGDEEVREHGVGMYDEVARGLHLERRGLRGVEECGDVGGEGEGGFVGDEEAERGEVLDGWGVWGWVWRVRARRRARVMVEGV